MLMIDNALNAREIHFGRFLSFRNITTSDLSISLS